jgi:hypothetical protein
MSKKFDIIFSNLIFAQSEVNSELFENRSLPVVIAFFALYHGLKFRSNYSRPKIYNFVLGADRCTDRDLYKIVSLALDGVKEWNMELQNPHVYVPYFENFINMLEDIKDTDLQKSLAPLFNDADRKIQ